MVLGDAFGKKKTDSFKDLVGLVVEVPIYVSLMGFLGYLISVPYLPKDHLPLIISPKNFKENYFERYTQKDCVSDSSTYYLNVSNK